MTAKLSGTSTHSIDLLMTASQLNYLDPTDPLALSKIQQAKFDKRAALLKNYLAGHARFDVHTSDSGATIVSEKYAFLHIFKNGGTTVELQTNRSQVPIWRPMIKNRKWIAVVRDPIDHFLAGWAECGERAVQAILDNKTRSELVRWKIKILNATRLSYDERIRRWIQACKRHTQRRQPHVHHDRVVPLRCETHSLPQANFMLVNGAIAPQLEIVGDLRELPAILEHVGLNYSHSIGAGRNASASDVKASFFPRRKDLISSTTMRSLCKFLAIDYFMFQYDPPKECLQHPTLS